jgi:hypothetical protein
MHAQRTFRMSAVIAAAALAVGAVVGTTTAASAAPHKPGNITGLHASVTPHVDTSYDVAAGWDAASNATSYRVSITMGGATLASAKVTSTSWSPTFMSAPGTASLSVKALNGHRPGKASTIPLDLKDVTPPQGSFSTTWDNNTGDATITQDSLTDNGPVSAVTRTVDWNDGSDPEAWTSGTTIHHTYPKVAARYVPTVTLTDGATPPNTNVVNVPAIVIDDTEAPTGAAYSVNRSTAWASFTKVKVTETSAPTDNWSPTAFITRVVDWGDGTTSTIKNGSASHVYTEVGSHTPSVTVSDEAHNSVVVDTTAVVVTADTVAPKVTLTLPKAKHSVKAWKTLRGKATDGQTGVKKVSLKAVEKRGASWFGYNAKTQKWIKAASKAKAFAVSKAFGLKTDARHRWAAKLAGLKKGTLVYKVWAVDQVGNRSATVTHSATLTKA